jgi:hypothetical protein
MHSLTATQTRRGGYEQRQRHPVGDRYPPPPAAPTIGAATVAPDPGHASGSGVAGDTVTLRRRE